MEKFPEFREILVHPDDPKVIIRTRVFGSNEKEFDKYSAKLLKLEGYQKYTFDKSDPKWIYWHYSVPDGSFFYWMEYCASHEIDIRDFDEIGN
jgi:hypothetical protein